MKSSTLKLITTTAGIGTIGMVAYFAGKKLFREQTIKEKLNGDNFKFISFDDQEQWVAEFSYDQENIKKLLGAQATSTSLRDWCTSKFDVSSSNKEDLENVRRWCLVRKISDQFGRGWRTLLVWLAHKDLEAKGDVSI